jgi:hypothetical protein
MNTGMLWFDNDPKKTLDAKVLQAADYFKHKYGRMPDTCMVNPLNLPETSPGSEPAKAGRITILPFRSIMPGHLWIGLEEELSSKVG